MDIQQDGAVPGRGRGERRKGRPVSPTGDQRVIRFAADAEAGDHRQWFARGAPRSSGRERCQNHQGDGDQGGCGDVLARAGLRSLAAEAADGHSRALPGGRLDKYWLAGDDGRRGPQWLFGRRGHPTRSRNSADILAAGLAGRNLGREYIRERRPTLKKFEEKNVQAAERRRLGSRRREKGSISFSERCAAKEMLPFSRLREPRRRLSAAWTFFSSNFFSVGRLSRIYSRPKFLPASPAARMSAEFRLRVGWPRRPNSHCGPRLPSSPASQYLSSRPPGRARECPSAASAASDRSPARARTSPQPP